MDKCSSCGEDTRYDEWHDHEKKRCINCGSDEDPDTIAD
jgi:hypothetical protein